MDYTKHARHRRALVPQSEPLPGTTQIPNSAGGHAWAVDKWFQLVRFLILGTERGTYYIGEAHLTRENTEAVRACIADDPQRVLASIAGVSELGLAAKQDATLYALALLFASAIPNEVKHMCVVMFPNIVRTASQLFTFVHFSRSLRGNGRMFRRTLARWYQTQSVDALGYQLVKYPQRMGYTHLDVLRFARMKPVDDAHAALYRFAKAQAMGTAEALTGALLDAPYQGLLPLQVRVAARMRANDTTAPTADDLNDIRTLRIPRECVPTQWLNRGDVWSALFDGMPMTALVRNLGNLSKHGVLVPFSGCAMDVCERLRDQSVITASRLHPLQLLAASYVYGKGSSEKGSGTWAPVTQVVEALHDAFRLAFTNVKASGKKVLVAVDVSGSMWSNGGIHDHHIRRIGDHGIVEASILPRLMNRNAINGMDYLTAAQGAAVMAMVIAGTEANAQVIAFDTEVIDGYPINGRTSLNHALACGFVGLRGTDCSAPMRWAASKRLDVDAFVIQTDNETWAGQVHPAIAVQKYRDTMGKQDARLAVVAMAANSFTIRAPDDARCMDFVGFDASAPAALATFLRGTI